MNIHPVKPHTVIDAACRVIGVMAGEVIGPTRKRTARAVVARTIFVGVMREVSGRSYPELTREITGRTEGHSAAITHDRRWQQWQDTDEIAPGLTKAAARQAVLTQLGLEGTNR